MKSQPSKQMTNNKDIVLIGMIEQVKQLALVNHQEQQEISSDSHCQNQDLEISKMKQFNNLITNNLINNNLQKDKQQSRISQSTQNKRNKIFQQDEQESKLQQYEVFKKIMAKPEDRKTSKHITSTKKKSLVINQVSSQSHQSQPLTVTSNGYKIFQNNQKRNNNYSEIKKQKSQKLLQYRFPDVIKLKIKKTLEQYENVQISKIQKKQKQIINNGYKTFTTNPINRQYVLKNKRLSSRLIDTKTNQQSFSDYLQGLNEHIKWKSERKNHFTFDGMFNGYKIFKNKNNKQRMSQTFRDNKYVGGFIIKNIKK